jgi:hypothetical protein
MKFLSVITSLGQISGGVLSAGRVPFNRLFRSGLVSNQNAGAVTILSSLTVIIANAQLTLTLNDWILIPWSLGFTKGATAGQTVAEIGGGGGDTGTVAMVSLQSGGIVAEWQNAIGDQVLASGIVLGQCTLAGTFTPSLLGTSAGSNSTVNINAGRISNIVLAAS